MLLAAIPSLLPPCSFSPPPITEAESPISLLGLPFLSSPSSHCGALSLCFEIGLIHTTILCLFSSPTAKLLVLLVMWGYSVDPLSHSISVECSCCTRRFPQNGKLLEGPTLPSQTLALIKLRADIDLSRAMAACSRTRANPPSLCCRKTAQHSINHFR